MATDYIKLDTEVAEVPVGASHDFSNFWLNGEHFDAETGDTALSVAEQIGRTAWLFDRALSDVAADALKGALDGLGALLRTEITKRAQVPSTKVSHLKPVG